MKQSIFASNDEQAEALRKELKKKKVFLLNLMSAPGSGKTTTLRRTIAALKDELRTACTALPSSVVKSTWRFLTSNSGPWARCMASRLFSVFISVIEYPFTYTQAVRLFGSRASLTASPIMMNASTVMASAADG